MKWKEWFNLRENNQAEALLSGIVQNIAGIHSSHINNFRTGGQNGEAWQQMDNQLRTLAKMTGDPAAGSLIEIWDKIKHQTNAFHTQAFMGNSPNGRNVDFKGYNNAVEGLWNRFHSIATSMLQKMHS